MSFTKKKKRSFEDVSMLPQEKEQENDLLDTFLNNLDDLLDGFLLVPFWKSTKDDVLTNSAIRKTQKKHRRERRSNKRNAKNTTSSSMRKDQKENPSSPPSDENEQEGILMIVQQPSFDVLANCMNPFACPLNTIFEAEEEKADDGIFNNFVVEPLRSVQNIIQSRDNDCKIKVQEEEDPLIGSTVHCKRRLEEDEEKSLSNRRQRLKLLKDKIREAREENENLEKEINQKDVYLIQYELQEVRKMNQMLREAIDREINRF